MLGGGGGGGGGGDADVGGTESRDECRGLETRTIYVGGGSRRNEDFWASSLQDRISRRDRSAWRTVVLHGTRFPRHFGTAHDFPTTQYLHEFICKNKMYVLLVTAWLLRAMHSHFRPAICNLSYTFQYAPLS